MLKINTWDPSKYLDSPEKIRIYLETMLEENGVKGFQKALGDVAKAKGMTELAQQTQLGRQSLYKSLSEEGNPNFETVYKIVRAMGCTIKIA